MIMSSNSVIFMGWLAPQGLGHHGRFLGYKIYICIRKGYIYTDVEFPRNWVKAFVTFLSSRITKKIRLIVLEENLLKGCAKLGKHIQPKNLRERERGKSGFSKNRIEVQDRGRELVY